VAAWRGRARVILLLRTDRTQVYLLRDILAMHGIASHVFNEHMSSIVGDVPPDVALPQLWLDDDADHVRARAVLRDHVAAGNRKGSLFCPACGEESPATFESCWNCGGAL
jgi:hypothetical protein